MTAQHHEAHTRKQFEVEDAEPVRIPVLKTPLFVLIDQRIHFLDCFLICLSDY